MNLSFSLNNNPLTEILLPAAGASFLTVGSASHSLFQKTFLPFPRPPLPNTPEHDFRSTVSAYPVPRRIRILINPSSDAVNVYK